MRGTEQVRESMQSEEHGQRQMYSEEEYTCTKAGESTDLYTLMFTHTNRIIREDYAKLYGYSN
jgi:hypothetical protein